jgi:hypothetical protein
LKEGHPAPTFAFGRDINRCRLLLFDASKLKYLFTLLIPPNSKLWVINDAGEFGNIGNIARKKR